MSRDNGEKKIRIINGFLVRETENISAVRKYKTYENCVKGGDRLLNFWLINFRIAINIQLEN